jgi:hypothetical protein
MIKGRDSRTLTEYMSEKNIISRFTIFRIALAGVFVGAILGLIVGLSGLIM